MQLVADVPLGVFLSGGIDSSAVAALAERGRARRRAHLHFGFDVPALDESRYARQVAEAIGSRHTNVVLTEQNFQEQLPDAFTAIDQPTFDGINTYFVSRAARDAGMTVALAGTGGDELFGGYASYVDIPGRCAVGDRLPWTATGETARFDRGRRAGRRVWRARLFWDLCTWRRPRRAGARSPTSRAPARLARPLPGLLRALHPRDPGVLGVERGSASGSGTRPAPRGRRRWRRTHRGQRAPHAISVLELSSFIGERCCATPTRRAWPSLSRCACPSSTTSSPRPSPASTRRVSCRSRKKQLLRELALARLDPALFDRPEGRLRPADRRLGAPAAAAADGASSRTDSRGPRRAASRRAVQTLWRSFLDGRPGLYWSRVWAIYVLCRGAGPTTFRRR